MQLPQQAHRHAGIETGAPLLDRGDRDPLVGEAHLEGASLSGIEQEGGRREAIAVEPGQQIGRHPLRTARPE
jgi:hypothetical protein